MAQVEDISTSGLFALYVLELIFSGQQAPEIAGGHGALRQMGAYFKDTDRHSAIYLENVPNSVKELLENVGIPTGSTL